VTTPLLRQQILGKQPVAGRRKHISVETLFSVGVSNLRQQNVVMNPAGLDAENDCNGEGQQQL
jgi:hypothetical protein